VIEIIIMVLLGTLSLGFDRQIANAIEPDILRMNLQLEKRQ